MARLSDALQHAGAHFQFVNTGEINGVRLNLEPGPQHWLGHLTLQGQSIPLQDIAAIYTRPLFFQPSAVNATVSQHDQATHQQLVEWFDIAPGLVVNRPATMQANSSKPFQIQLIGKAGFLVPPTLVSSDADEVNEFWRRHGRVIFKSISGIRSIVTELDAAWVARLDRLAYLPTQFQAWVPGVDIRVHVVGRETFAAEINSHATDYRYAQRNSGTPAQIHATVLPLEIAAKCIALAESMALPLAGIDLRRRLDGEYVCFEVNPMPAYSYFEAESGLPIAAALAQLLMAADHE